MTIASINFLKLLQNSSYPDLDTFLVAILDDLEGQWWGDVQCRWP